jgi:hypothetical protein
MKQLFTCALYLKVIQKDGECLFSREVDLPFVPFVGLTLNFDLFEDDKSEEENMGTEFSAHRIEWVVNADCFWLWGKEDYSQDCGCKAEDNCCSIDKEIAWNTARGWEVWSDVSRWPHGRPEEEYEKEVADGDAT